MFNLFFSIKSPMKLSFEEIYIYIYIYELRIIKKKKIAALIWYITIYEPSVIRNKITNALSIAYASKISCLLV